MSTERLGRASALTAAVLLVASMWLPYWRVRVTAPQYPQGLVIIVYPHRLAGDIRELDILNHYVGMKPLEQAAQLERRIAIPVLMVMALLLTFSAFAASRLSIVPSLPALLFPMIFIGDLYWWLRHYGLSLDPKAPLNRSVKPFMPPLLGKAR